MTAAKSEARPTAYLVWTAASAMVLAFAFATWALGDRFVFGEGHAERPIWTFLGVYTLGWCGLALACLGLWKGQTPPLILILGVAFLARGVLLDSNLIQSSDVYRYVLDGESVLHGVNPYRERPVHLPRNAPEPYRSELDTAEARRLLDRVSYPDIRTIYPPLAQAAFAAGAWLTPWDWLGQRIVFTICDAAIIGVLIALLLRLGMPAAWVVLYAWNPLILKEIVNSAHADSLAALGVVNTFYFAARGHGDDRNRWPFLCGVTLGAAVLAKLYPALLVPALAGYWFAQASGMRKSALFCSALAGCVVLAYIPFLGAGLDALTEGLRRYAGEWRRNEGLFAVLAAVAPGYAREVYAVLVAACALGGACYIVRRKPSFDGLVSVAQFTLLAWLLLSPSPYPWYATTLLVVSVLRPRAWHVVMSGALAVYYYSFIHEYRAHTDAWLGVGQGMEHGVILVAVAISLLFEFRAGRAPAGASSERSA